MYCTNLSIIVAAHYLVAERCTGRMAAVDSWLGKADQEKNKSRDYYYEVLPILVAARCTGRMAALGTWLCKADQKNQNKSRGYYYGKYDT